MPAPEKGVFLLRLANTNKGPPPSSHGVQRYIAKQPSGEKFLGYFKKCNETYPQELAQYNIAFSIHMRMVVGDRASEELPVYDAQNNLIGTFSVELPNFKGMLATGDKRPLDEAEYEHVCPNLDKLIEYNICELLLAHWRRKNDDLHPANLGLQGTIDFEMMMYHKTAELKGMRLVSGTLLPWPSHAFPITHGDILNFPEIINARPCFWPTKRPENLNFSRDYKNREEFLKLKNHPKFLRQKYVALLKEILMYDENVLRARLAQYINDASFVNNCLLFFRSEQNELYRILTSMPEFMRAIKEDPSIATESLLWFYDENKKQPQARKHHIGRIELNLLLLWKDSFVELFYKILCQLSSLVMDVREIQYDQNIPNIELLSINENDLNQSYLLLERTTLMEKSARSASSNASIGYTLMNFYNEIRTQLLQFYKSRTDSVKDHREFVNNIRFCTAKAIEQVSKQIPPIYQERWDEISNALNTIAIEDMTLPEELCKQLSASSQSTSSAQPEEAPLLLGKAFTSLYMHVPVPRPNQIKTVADLLCDWIQEQEYLKLKSIIEEADKQYEPVGHNSILGYVNPFAYTKQRAVDVKSLLSNLAEVKKSDYLNLFCVFSSKGGWDKSSLNTLLFRELCKNMAIDYSLKLDKFIAYGDKNRFSTLSEELSEKELHQIRDMVYDKQQHQPDRMYDLSRSATSASSSTNV